jgi:Domain of unknown function (DUF4279)
MFRITEFEVDPQQITQDIGLQPTRVWQKGDRIHNTNAKRSQSGWELKSELPSEQNVVDHIRFLVTKFWDIKENLEKIETSKMGIYCALYIYNGDRPCFFIDNEITRKLGLLNFILDIDLYALDDIGSLPPDRLSV